MVTGPNRRQRRRKFLTWRCIPQVSRKCPVSIRDKRVLVRSKLENDCLPRKRGNVPFNLLIRETYFSAFRPSSAPSHPKSSIPLQIKQCIILEYPEARPDRIVGATSAYRAGYVARTLTRPSRRGEKSPPI